MTTPAEQMKFIVEKTPGMCWHEVDKNTFMCSCGETCLKAPCGYHNPSPTDLNALIEIARKNGVYAHVYESMSTDGGYCSTVHNDILDISILGEDAPADALRLAIYKALGGKDE